jgi:hypothetical protein
MAVIRPAQNPLQHRSKTKNARTAIKPSLPPLWADTWINTFSKRNLTGSTMSMESGAFEAVLLDDKRALPESATVQMSGPKKTIRNLQAPALTILLQNLEKDHASCSTPLHGIQPESSMTYQIPACRMRYLRRDRRLPSHGLCQLAHLTTPVEARTPIVPIRRERWN